MIETDEGEAESDDELQDLIDLEAQRRLWIKALVPILQMRSHGTDPSSRVQLAFDLMHIAACERAARILRSDLAGDAG